MREGIVLRVEVPSDALPAAAPRAEFFSQKNAEQLLGIPARRFLELLRREDAPPVKHLGKLRLVERDPMLAFLRALDHRDAKPANAPDEDEGDAVLREIGCIPTRRVG